MTITLTGFMGCGKSSVGKEMAAMLGCHFIDLDEYIEKKEGRSIPEIFSEGGEKSFREIEQAALSEVVSDTGRASGPVTVLSLGGGTLTTEECARIVKNSTYCIYLRATTDILVANLENDHEGRPMLGGSTPLREKIRTLMDQRAATYENTASLIIDIDGRRFRDIAAEIIEKTGIRPETEAGGQTVWDPLRKKEVSLTPEEKVRQWCIRFLSGQMRIPGHMMMSETGFKLGGKHFRADILVYGRNARPLAVVECKRPEVKIDRKVLEQAIRYNMVLDVKYIIISNGHRTIILKKEDGRYVPLSSAPVYEEMLK